MVRIIELTKKIVDWGFLVAAFVANPVRYGCGWVRALRLMVKIDVSRSNRDVQVPNFPHKLPWGCRTHGPLCSRNLVHSAGSVLGFGLNRISAASLGSGM
jgi:hypothetical protein